VYDLCHQQIVCHRTVIIDAIYYAGNVSMVGSASLVVLYPLFQAQVKCDYSAEKTVIGVCSSWYK
jgi:hypothetical protein